MNNDLTLTYTQDELSDIGSKFMLIVVHQPAERDGMSTPSREKSEIREEAIRLVNALDVDLVHIAEISLKKVNSNLFLGRGMADELKAIAHDKHVSVAVVDAALTPVQQRNLERHLKVKILDRTALILEIFGDRAQTKEGRLQVELAHLIYQKSRLVRSWTHLERQRGGLGFIGGPGESQLESDKRQIQTRILQLQKQLDKVRQTRDLHRKQRQKVPYPIIVLVGYTNAGKSTLFNALSEASVFAEDMLFATLDPTARKVKLPTGREVILIDTVGFISNLPTELVEAFKATLEEVGTADIILHIRDIHSSVTEIEKWDVEQTLRQLGVEPENGARVIEVWNKADMINTDMRQVLETRILALEKEQNTKENQNVHPVLVSAFEKTGFDQLEDRIDLLLSTEEAILKIAVPPEDGAGYGWLHERGFILNEAVDERYTRHLTVRLQTKHVKAAQQRFTISSEGDV